MCALSVARDQRRDGRGPKLLPLQDTLHGKLFLIFTHTYIHIILIDKAIRVTRVYLGCVFGTSVVN